MPASVASYAIPQAVGGHSEYIVYVDERGDHSLSSVDPDYPVFVLSFCIFHKGEHAQAVTPAIRQLKFATFGHDMVMLHEADIWRKKEAFSQLPKEPREASLEALTDIVGRANLHLVAVVIDKRRLKDRCLQPAHPYHLAVELGLERIHRLHKGAGQNEMLTYIVCEARGAREDAELELEFRRIRDGANYFHRPSPFDLFIADKKTNTEGLQRADLMARPIGLAVLRPGQVSRAAQVLEGKFYWDKTGNKRGMGLKVFP